MKYLSIISLYIFFAGLVSLVAQTIPPPPQAGNYNCYSLSLKSRPGYEDRINIRTGETEPKIILSPSTQFVPALFSLRLTEKGGYALVNTTGKGTYRYNPKTGGISFTGDINKLKPRSYFVKDGTYIFQFQPDASLFFQCEKGGGGAAAGKNTGPLNEGLKGRIITTESTADNYFYAKVFEFDLASGGGRILFQNGTLNANQAGQIVYIDKNARISITDRNGNILSKLKDDAENDIRDMLPSISPDGNYVAIAAGIQQGFFRSGDKIIVADKKGSRVAEFDGFKYSAWMPDGRLILSGSEGKGGIKNEGLFAVDKRFGKPMRLLSGFADASMPAVSSDGSKIAFVHLETIWIINSNGSGAFQILKDNRSAFPAWSPDGKHIITGTIDPTSGNRLLGITNLSSLKSFWVKDNSGGNIRSNNRIVWLP